MTQFLLYTIIAIEILLVGIEHLIHWKLHEKRKEDIRVFIMNSLLFLSFLFYGVQSARFSPQLEKSSILIQNIIDYSLMIYIAFYFFKKMKSDLIKK